MAIMWLATRCSSAAMTRRYMPRSVGWMPASFSTVSTYAWLLVIDAV